MNRRIAIIGEINTEAYLKFSDELAELEYELKNSDDNEITLELSSEGGSAELAQAFSGRMRNTSLFIHIKAYGLVASAAVLILASGDKRSMSKESWVMVHEEGLELEGDVSGIEKQAAHFRRLEDQWAYLLASMTHAGVDEWSRLHKAETYLNAKQCLELGLIDRVI